MRVLEVTLPSYSVTLEHYSDLCMTLAIERGATHWRKWRRNELLAIVVSYPTRDVDRR